MWQMYYFEGEASQLDKGMLYLPFSFLNWLPSVTFLKTLTSNVNWIPGIEFGIETRYTRATPRGMVATFIYWYKDKI